VPLPPGWTRRRIFRLARTFTVLAVVVIVIALLVSRRDHGTVAAGSSTTTGHESSAPTAATRTTTPPTTQPPAPTTLSVTTLPVRLSSARSREVAVSDGMHVLVAGGQLASGTSSTDVLTFDPAANTVGKTGKLATGVHDAAGAFINGETLVFGGGTETHTIGTVQAVAADGTGRVTGRLPAPRSDVSAVVTGDHAIVVGGFDGSNPTLDILSTTDGTTFTTVGRLAEPVRYAAAVINGTTLYVIGGEWNGTFSSSVQAFDLTAGGTADVSMHLPTGLAHANAFVLDGGIYVAGGRTAATAYTDEISRLDPATGQTTPAGALPAAESDAAAAVVGSTAYLLGGERNGKLDTIVAVSVPH
jgi:N-acetylneuraminic acid mutarotase